MAGMCNFLLLIQVKSDDWHPFYEPHIAMEVFIEHYTDHFVLLLFSLLSSSLFVHMKRWQVTMVTEGFLKIQHNL